MKKSHGFTLIELLVVIAIIAILAAILFPVFAVARERGRQARCLSNLRNLAIAFREYLDDNDNKMPTLYPGLMGPSAGTMANGGMWDWCGCTGLRQQVIPAKGSLYRYVRNANVYVCPSDKNIPPKYVAGNLRNYGLSYTVNEGLNEKDGLYDARIRGRAFRKIDAMPNSRLTRIMLLLHESRNTIDDGNCWPPGNIPSDVHYDGTTLAYLDGHASWKPYKRLCAECNNWDPDAKNWTRP
jgi:prepilin-type N-terminal cleavage/methylation domain-containing protein